MMKISLRFRPIRSTRDRPEEFEGRPFLLRLALAAGLLNAILVVLFLPAGAIRAVTFDGDLRALNADTLNIGGAGEWDSINQTIFLASGGNVGIGASAPNDRLEVNGGLRLMKDLQGAGFSYGSCTSAVRGMLEFVPASPSATDALAICMKNASNTYAWICLDGSSAPC